MKKYLCLVLILVSGALFAGEQTNRGRRTTANKAGQVFQFAGVVPHLAASEAINGWKS